MKEKKTAVQSTSTPLTPTPLIEVRSSAPIGYGARQTAPYNPATMSEQPISRRSAIRICGAGAISLTIPESPVWMFAEPNLVECQNALDHIMVGASDLDAGIAWFEKLTGVRPVFAGSPVGRAKQWCCPGRRAKRDSIDWTPTVPRSHCTGSCRAEWCGPHLAALAIAADAAAVPSENPNWPQRLMLPLIADRLLTDAARPKFAASDDATVSALSNGAATRDPRLAEKPFGLERVITSETGNLEGQRTPAIDRPTGRR